MKTSHQDATFRLDEELAKEIWEFTVALEAETRVQQKRLESGLDWMLAFYAAALSAFVFVILKLPISDKAGMFLIIAGCTFALICAVKSVAKAVLLSGFQTAVNIRYLATFLHEFRTRLSKQIDPTQILTGKAQADRDGGVR